MFDDFSSLLAAIALIVLIVTAVRQNTRLSLLQRETGALRSFVLSALANAPSTPSAAETSAGSTSTAERVVVTDAVSAASAFDSASEPAGTATGENAQTADTDELPGEPIASEAEQMDSVRPGPWQTGPGKPDEPAKRAEATSTPHARPRGDLETALGTQWAVWVGGVALALGGIFLVRYTIEAGFFGPAFRLTLAFLFGAGMMALGEYIRRTGFSVPVPGIANAYIPAILTAVGALTLFATIYAAHGVYGFIGPATAFILLGVIGVATTLLALIHGQALAGVGILGSFVTPVLVSSQTPNPWALFGYLAVVLVSAVAVSRIRRWRFLASAAFAGMGLWVLIYLVEVATPDLDLWVLLFANSVTLAALALVWLHGEAGEKTLPVLQVFPAALPAFFVALIGIALLVDPALQTIGGRPGGLALLVAMLAIAAWKAEALPLLFGAGIATILAYIRVALVGDLTIGIMGADLTVDGLPVGGDVNPLFYPGIALGLLFLGVGMWKGRMFASVSQRRATVWALFGAVVPLVIVGSLWLGLGDPNIDPRYAVAALALSAILLAAAEWIARAETPSLAGGPAVSAAIGGSGAALVLSLHMAFGPGLTTILVGAAAVLPALATRHRSYPVLGWLCVSAAIVVLARVAIDPSIVGPLELGTTPIFNALLPGYGIPALAFGLAAWQLARTARGSTAWLAMQAAAALFALLTLAMLVRHGMNGGVITSDAPSLAEQAIYSIIALGAGGILIALDTRAPSSVFRYGSIGIGVASVAAIVIQHFLLLNPVLTNESTGQVPFFNLLFLAYLLPALAAAGLAYYARPKRPRWYAIMLALTAAALAFTYATLSVRRVFKGEFIGYLSGTGDAEFYTYSAVWLVMSVILLVIGVKVNSYVLRVASGVLIALSVAKVFLLDMSELEGILRALSFMGLGGVLIGIGLFYQRLLTTSAKQEAAASS